MIRVVTHTDRAEAIMEKLRASLIREKTSPIIEKEAWKTMGRLVVSTPKRWTGQTRRGWTVTPIENGFRVTNENRVMLFLEEGTKAHGPTKSKFLYIPLRPEAMIWRPGLVRGVDFVLKKRVNGIIPRRIVFNERPIAAQLTREAMERYVQGEIVKVIT